MSTIRLAFLGPPRLYHADQSVDLSIAKMHGLLAYLAVARTPQPRVRLLDLLWANSAPDAARKNLRNNLWQLRQAVAEEIVITAGDMLALAPDVDTDIATFEKALLVAPGSASMVEGAGPTADALSAAIALWRGPLLADFTLTDAPDFELWLDGERMRLAQLYQRALMQLVTNYRHAGDWTNVLAIAQRGLVHDAADEAMHVAAMEAYAHLGRLAAARRQYDALHAALAELALAPQPATQRVHEQIHAQSFGSVGEVSTSSASARLGPAQAGAPLPISALLRPRPRQPIVSPFVGRQAELNELDMARERAAAGHLRIVLLDGELGIGKSTLWRQWSAPFNTSTAGVVLETRCLAATKALPFAPLVALFDRQISLERLCASQSPLSAVWLIELARLLPQIRDHRPDLPLAAALPPEEERRRLFEAFVQVIMALDGTPLLLFVDDLHWADQATLNWLVYLSERMRATPLLLAAAYRPDEAEPALLDASAHWARAGVLTQLTLTPLSHAEATTLVAALAGDVNMADYLYAQSGGNPYYLTELNQVHPDGRPAALRDLIHARLSRLPPGALRLLQAAAVLEPVVNFELVQELSGQSVEEALDNVDALLAAGVLAERGERYEFAHPLQAETVRLGLSQARRKHLHRQAAEHLFAACAGQPESVAGQLAHHYQAAGDRAAAAHFAEMAATHAVQMAAMAEAVAFWRQAYALEPTPARQLALGHALMYIPGGLQEARVAMQQAFDAAEMQKDHKGLMQAGLRLAFSYLSTAEGEQVLEWAERVAVNLGATDDVELRATVEYLMGAGKLNSSHNLADADRHYRTATELAATHEVASEIAIQSWFSWGNLSLEAGEFGEAQRKFTQTRALAAAARDIYFEALSYNNLAHAALMADDLTTAHAMIEQGLTFIAYHELLRPRQYLYSTRGEVALAAGELGAAEAWLTRALEEAVIYENVIHAANIRAHLGRVAQARGDFDAAAARFADARNMLPARGAQHLQIQFNLWLADFHQQRGDSPGARQALAAAEAQLAGTERQALRAAATRLREKIAVA